MPAASKPVALQLDWLAPLNVSNGDIHGLNPPSLIVTIEFCVCVCVVDSQVLIHQSKQGEYPTPQSTHTKKREKLIANKNEVLLHIKIDIRFTTYIYTYLHLYIAFENDLFDLMGGIWFLFFWSLCLLCS